MKKYLLLLTASLSLKVALGQTNEYLINDPQWQVYFYCPNNNPPCFHKKSFNYYVSGDTLINSLTYKKIFEKGMGEYLSVPYSQFCTTGLYSYKDSIPSYFLRSIGKQMFLRRPGLDTTEHLLYDFNLGVGDTLPLSFNNFQNDVCVIAIDSIFTQYGYRKRFSLSGTTPTPYLIEGIGHSGGFIGEPLAHPYNCTNLVCFSLNDTAYYPSVGGSCNLAVGISSYGERSRISFHPNPFFIQTTLKMDNYEANTSLSVYNSFGQLVKQIDNLSGQSIIFRRDNLPGGLYFIKLMQDNKTLATDKLIITDN